MARKNSPAASRATPGTASGTAGRTANGTASGTTGGTASGTAAKVRRRKRLRRSDTGVPGITRRGAGKGFAFYAPDGGLIRDAEEKDRLTSLAVPPAWTDVWICPQDNGHIQATGVDDAGRRQYIYHARWRELQDERKFEAVLDFGEALPRLRPMVTRLLCADGVTADTALAAAFRIMDECVLRVGNEEYTLTNGSYGVTTMLVGHVSIEGQTVRFDFPAKSGHHVDREVRDADLAAALTPMLERGVDEPALAYPAADGQWRPITSTQYNEFLRELSGLDISAKDFRTWHGTVAAAIALADRADTKNTQTARKRAVAAAMRDVAERLDNTPAIARNSYVDPRVIDRFHHGDTIDASTYRAAERNLRDFVS